MLEWHFLFSICKVPADLFQSNRNLVWLQRGRLCNARGGGEVLSNNPLGVGGKRVKAWERGKEGEEKQEMPWHREIQRARHSQCASNLLESIRSRIRCRGGFDDFTVWGKHHHSPHVWTRECSWRRRIISIWIGSDFKMILGIHPALCIRFSHFHKWFVGIRWMCKEAERAFWVSVAQRSFHLNSSALTD